MISFLNQVYSGRELIWELAMRDLKVRYSRPFLGFLWAFIFPIFTVSIFYLVFSCILKISIEGTPFLLYLMSGLFAWNFFQESIASSTSSLMQSRNLLKESGFPHYFIPLSIIIANTINALPSLGILCAVSAFFLKGLPMAIIFFPVLLLVQLCIAFALSLIASVAYVKWRDSKYIVDMFLLLCIYLTPTFYSLQQVKNTLPSWAFKLYLSNPLVGILNGYRIIFLKGFTDSLRPYVDYVNLIIIPCAWGIGLLCLAIVIYRKAKAWINDYLSY